MTIFFSVQNNVNLSVCGIPMFLTHKPEDALPNLFNLVGHIHDKWKVQRNMINVGTDAFHFLPVSEQQIEMLYTGIKKHYDKNVFIGESPQALVPKVLAKLVAAKHTIKWMKPRFFKEFNVSFLSISPCSSCWQAMFL